MVSGISSGIGSISSATGGIDVQVYRMITDIPLCLLVNGPVSCPAAMRLICRLMAFPVSCQIQNKLKGLAGGRVSMGAGCGVGIGYGFGAGIVIKPSALQSITRGLQSIAGGAKLTKGHSCITFLLEPPSSTQSGSMQCISRWFKSQ